MSPHELLQERVPRDELYPWRVIVLCSLLNKTPKESVARIMGGLFERWPTPRAMRNSGPDLETLFRPLGLGYRKAKMLRRMSADYDQGVPAAECRGVGQYARDALAIFVDGRLDVEPDDGKLGLYLEWARSRAKETA